MQSGAPLPGRMWDPSKSCLDFPRLSLSSVRDVRGSSLSTFLSRRLVWSSLPPLHSLLVLRRPRFQRLHPSQRRRLLQRLLLLLLPLPVLLLLGAPPTLLCSVLVASLGPHRGLVCPDRRFFFLAFVFGGGSIDYVGEIIRRNWERFEALLKLHLRVLLCF